MGKRIGVSGKRGIQPALERTGSRLRRASCATLHKDETWPTTKEHLRLDVNVVASAFYRGLRTCRLRSERSGRQETAREINSFGSRGDILSGFPTINTRPFFRQSNSRPISCVGGHDRRPAHAPLPREDILHISHLVSSTPPPGPDVIPNFDL